MLAKKISEQELRERLLKPLDELRANKNREQETLNEDVDKLKMSIIEYINNPTGKGTAYVANRGAIKQGLNLQFIKLLRQYRKAFYAIPYIYSNGDILYYVKVPSEFYKENRISYDVLFLLKYDSSKRRAKRDMQLFSNSPSFVYTYCYVYNKNGLIIDKIKDKLPNEALTQPPVVRNPVQTMGYDKSTYIAARYLQDGGCLTDEYVNRHGQKIDKNSESSVFSKIADANLLVSIYQHAKYKQYKTHKKELSDEEKKRRDDRLKEYSRKEKENAPKQGFIIHKSPRAKINARSAKKALMNEGTQPVNHVIKPKNKI